MRAVLVSSRIGKGAEAVHFQETFNSSSAHLGHGFSTPCSAKRILILFVQGTSKIGDLSCAGDERSSPRTACSRGDVRRRGKRLEGVQLHAEKELPCPQLNWIFGRYGAHSVQVSRCTMVSDQVRENIFQMENKNGLVALVI